MKTGIIIICLIFSSAYLLAQDDTTAIRNVMGKQLAAWNNGDINMFMQTYWQSDSLMFIGSSAPTYGWQKTLKHYKECYPDTATMGKLSFNLIQMRKLSDEYYLVVGEWHLKRTLLKDIGGYFTLLFRKINGEWKIVVDHTS